MWVGGDLKFSIITPTIQRDSLRAACASINTQTHKDWFHVVMVDRKNLREDLLASIAHPQRKIVQCPVEHRDFGNTCRHNAWELTEGCRYQIVLDDDNLFADQHILSDINAALEVCIPMWAIFPILIDGRRFFNDPPGLRRSDTANVVADREIARWPAIPDYVADGIWIEALRKNYPYKAFPSFRPIVIMDQPRGGA